MRVSTRTREGTNKYHHADCYDRGDKSSFYGFAALDAEARAAILSGRSTEAPAAAAPPPPCNDKFCAHGPGCPGRTFTGLGEVAAAAPPPPCNDKFCAHGPGCPGRTFTGLGEAAAPSSSTSAPVITTDTRTALLAKYSNSSNTQPAKLTRDASASPPTAQSLCFEVVGWSWNRQNTRAPAAGDSLVLVRQPDNPKDANALLVRNSAGDKLGFLPAPLAAHLSPELDGGTLELRDCSCHIWNDHGTCVLRATPIGTFPPAALPFLVTVKPAPRKKKLPAAAAAPTPATKARRIANEGDGLSAAAQDNTAAAAVGGAASGGA